MAGESPATPTMTTQIEPYDPLQNLTDACGDIIAKSGDDPDTVVRCVKLFKRMIKDAGRTEHSELTKFKQLAAQASSALSNHAHPHCDALVKEIHEALGL